MRTLNILGCIYYRQFWDASLGHSNRFIRSRLQICLKCPNILFRKCSWLFRRGDPFQIFDHFRNCRDIRFFLCTRCSGWNYMSAPCIHFHSHVSNIKVLHRPLRPSSNLCMLQNQTSPPITLCHISYMSLHKWDLLASGNMEWALI